MKHSKELEKKIMDVGGQEDWDSFTGLLSKVASIDYAKKTIRQKVNGQITLCMIDLDKFKEINDAYGHLFGDSVILKVSEIIRTAVGTKGIAARFGGDEFFLVFDEKITETELREILRYIRTQLAMAFVNTEENLVVTCSIGVSQYPQNGNDFDTLFAKADRGLYIAKNKGRNRYILYKEEMHGELPKNGEHHMSLSIQDTLNTNQILRGTADAIAELIRGGVDSLPKVMEQVRILYGFDYVTIYSGKELKRGFCCGKLSYPLPDLSCVYEEKVLNLFNMNGAYRMNISQPFGDYIEEYHGKYKEHHVREVMQYLIGDKVHLRGVLSFENDEADNKDSQMPSDERQHFLVIFARVLGEIVL